MWVLYVVASILMLSAFANFITWMIGDDHVNVDPEDITDENGWEE